MHMNCNMEEVNTLKYFTKNELKSGMKVTTRDGNEYLCVKDFCYGDLFGLIHLGTDDRTYYLTLDHFRDDLSAYNPANDIVKVQQLSISDMNNLIKHIRDLYYNNPTNLEWLTIAQEIIFRVE